MNATRGKVYYLNWKIVWKLVQQPEICSVICVKWTYDIKLNKDNKIERFKSRLVRKGFMQIQDVDFDKVYSLVSK